MALVDYSDSDASDTEQTETKLPSSAPQTKSTTATASSTSNSNFSTAKLVDKANPAKIRVQLGHSQSHASQSDEPVAKRPRTGGAFSGFNAQLPPPKHDNDKAAGAGAGTGASKPTPRKVFSLKTGAEPAFSRESDAELRQLFAEQDSSKPEASPSTNVAKPSTSASASASDSTGASSTATVTGNAFMFKPLSVARPKHSRTKPKKQPANASVASATPSLPQPKEQTQPTPAAAAAPAKKISLFSSGEPADIPDHIVDHEDEITPIDNIPGPDPDPDPALHDHTTIQTDQKAQPQTLSSIADDLNLSEADKRQLFGRGHGGSSKGRGASAAATTTMALNITNFNADHEYAANQELIAKGDQVIHNPVRAIAPGKHSLRQLVSAAQGQKDALEDSFATGKRNKKEAGSKYGW